MRGAIVMALNLVEWEESRPPSSSPKTNAALESSLSNE